jgi:hypothetical protein
MNRIGTSAVLMFALGAIASFTPAPGRCGSDNAIGKDIAALEKQGRGSAEGRAAWDRLSQAGPDALVPLLNAMCTGDTVLANWLRTAFDPIVERELKSGGKRIDADALLAFVRDARKQGRARRLALEVVEKLRPGISEKLYPGWLDDPEFRYEAVARVLESAGAALKKKLAKDAERQFQTAFESARDQQQLRDAAAGLAQLGVTVSVARQMGFLTDWLAIGPFDGMGQKGFHIEYPPERKVDLDEVLVGQGRKVPWKRLAVREPSVTAKGGHQALVNLADKAALGNADDAVGFAYTEFVVPKAIEAEFRGAADDNLTVWVNGKKAFGFEEWRNGVRLDRHRFKVRLNAGKNTVLVKVCQSAAPNPEPNWEFFLRVVDATGKGIAMKNALPE